MREIKFRVWNENCRLMISYDNNEVKRNQYKSSYLFGAMDGDYGDVLMQFTGITDKNDVDIYEGDIIQNERGRVCKVIWFQPGGCWDACFLRDTEDGRGLDRGFNTNHWPGFVEVIGDIHSNPELLK